MINERRRAEDQLRKASKERGTPRRRTHSPDLHKHKSSPEILRSMVSSSMTAASTSISAATAAATGHASLGTAAATTAKAATSAGATVTHSVRHEQTGQNRRSTVGGSPEPSRTNTRRRSSTYDKGLHRPPSPPPKQSGPPNARAWWRYALECVALKRQQEARDYVSTARLSRRRKHYSQLVKHTRGRAWRPPLYHMTGVNVEELIDGREFKASVTIQKYVRGQLARNFWTESLHDEPHRVSYAAQFLAQFWRNSWRNSSELFSGLRYAAMPTLDAEQHKKLDRVLQSAARWKRKSTEDHNGVEAPAARAARLARGRREVYEQQQAHVQLTLTQLEDDVPVAVMASWRKLAELQVSAILAQFWRNSGAILRNSSDALVSCSSSR